MSPELRNTDSSSPFPSLIFHFFGVGHSVTKKKSSAWFADHAIHANLLKGEFEAKKIIPEYEHLCLIKSHILHESDNLCRINTMFEDLILAFYLLITIVRRFFFANAIAYSMVGISHAERKHSV